MDESSNSFYSDLHASLNEDTSFDPSNLDGNKLRQLLKEKTKASHYIKNCKTIMKRQGEQLKKQEKEFQQSVSALETQSFTTKFHAVAFRLELDVMKLIAYRRKLDAILTKKYFQKYKTVSRAQRMQMQRNAHVLAPKLKKACFSLWFILKRRYSSSTAAVIEKLKYKKNVNEQEQELCISLKTEKRRLEKQVKRTNPERSIEELLEENSSLKEKLQNTEKSVTLFIKDMGYLLDKNELPGDHARPQKKKVKPKQRSSLLSGDIPKKFRNFLVQFD